MTGTGGWPQRGEDKAGALCLTGPPALSRQAVVWPPWLMGIHPSPCLMPEEVDPDGAGQEAAHQPRWDSVAKGDSARMPAS